LFRGGAANEIRRHRRVKAIGAVLTKLGFNTKIDRDSIYARLSKAPRDEVIQHLIVIGRLFQFFRQMDGAMTSEESVKIVSEAFLNEQFDLSSPPDQI
ncbi:MAG: phosphoenolpyruvate synthase, partial [Deltaproteobacteria bacterium]|nr:phosphoenolpyruvate synthase [Deltaproteobacteria bacterium]